MGLLRFRRSNPQGEARGGSSPWAFSLGKDPEPPAQLGKRARPFRGLHQFGSSNGGRKQALPPPVVAKTLKIEIRNENLVGVPRVALLVPCQACVEKRSVPMTEMKWLGTPRTAATMGDSDP